MPPDIPFNSFPPPVVPVAPATQPLAIPGVVAHRAKRDTTPPLFPAGVMPASPWLRFGAYLLEGLLVIVTLFVGWMIWAAILAQRGQTPAKRLLKLRVIDAKKLVPVGFAKMFWIRGILADIVAQIAILCTLGVLVFLPFWDKRKQNLWDKVSSTYVVCDPNDAWK